VAEQRRVVIYGNAGSGKTTMARSLGLPVLNLDKIAWASTGVRASLTDSLAALHRFIAAHSEWVIEGCYGDLVEAAVAHCTELRFLNPGAEVCVANARRRPWEPDYCESPEEQQRFLVPLIKFIHEYETVAGEYGLARHRAIFAAFRGPKREYTQQDAEQVLPAGLSSDRPAVLGGTCSARFEPLRELFKARLESGEELGASFAVNIDGEMVVDLWGGWTDEAHTVPWAEHTITNVFSTTKTMTALSALVLVDRGELDLDATVARYWPEFAARGKEGIKVRQFLSHTSGVSGWDRPVALEDLYDWDKSTAMLAAQAPWWKPGTASGYHAHTYGHLIGEVIRRITGQRLGQFFAANIARPLGADFHIGLPVSEFYRVANVVPFESLPRELTEADPDSLVYKTFFNPTLGKDDGSWLGDHSWRERWRRADIGAGNGHGNARSVARIQSAVACGGAVDGVRLLSPKTIDRILEVQSHMVDLVAGVPFRWGLGYGLPIPELPFVPQGRLCLGGGAGGSLVIADVDRRMTVAFVMNKMVPCLLATPTAVALVERLYDIVGR
jgi:CubicO group peptidase (beta-lactamase class C family)